MKTRKARAKKAIVACTPVLRPYRNAKSQYHFCGTDGANVWAIRALSSTVRSMTIKQSCSAYTSATSAKRQNDSDTQRKSAPLQAALSRVHSDEPARSSYNRKKSRLTVSAPKRAENRL